ncbi:MAG: Bax inhibitor-1/YccA family protein [Candidatus Koribacter versatilis]|uniref:Bax inhibitor-1/YccA family protein n=1 Tax=Candidatus Korobacter versatilis TaxID=658062 RepID=A0A932A7X1_9BACT|nr:Bax inhibitor-1/YccA family protein [Candidatus Koribacter versatilis]
MSAQGYTLGNVAAAEKTFIQRVYGWMAAGLTLTGMVAWVVANDADMVNAIIMNRAVFWGLLLLELALVWILTAAIGKMSAGIATSMFLVYAGVNGMTLAVIFLAYTRESIATTFFVTAGTFGAMCVYGMATQRDLTSVGSFCFMALIGLILASVVNVFLHSTALYWVTTYAGILIFVGLTAYDAQKIKQMHAASVEGSEEAKKGSVMGALALYLDFINLFLMLLRLLGRRR